MGARSGELGLFLATGWAGPMSSSQPASLVLCSGSARDKTRSSAGGAHRWGRGLRPAKGKCKTDEKDSDPASRVETLSARVKRKDWEAQAKESWRRGRLPPGRGGDGRAGLVVSTGLSTSDVLEICPSHSLPLSGIKWLAEWWEYVIRIIGHGCKLSHVNCYSANPMQLPADVQTPSHLGERGDGKPWAQWWPPKDMWKPHSRNLRV